MNNPYQQGPFNTGLNMNAMEDLADQTGKEIVFCDSFVITFLKK